MPLPLAGHRSIPSRVQFSIHSDNRFRLTVIVCRPTRSAITRDADSDDELLLVPASTTVNAPPGTSPRSQSGASESSVTSGTERNGGAGEDDDSDNSIEERRRRHNLYYPEHESMSDDSDIVYISVGPSTEFFDDDRTAFLLAQLPSYQAAHAGHFRKIERLAIYQRYMRRFPYDKDRARQFRPAIKNPRVEGRGMKLICKSVFSRVSYWLEQHCSV
ncbi:hypothetical protein PENSPDRAFT_671599 [Peniophora sp. CONT]|nr:hypothetical protein PENSPDRAFT_671599 [Peniophora sp. CONT]